MLAEAVRDDGRTHFRVTEDGDPVPDAAGETATSVFADLFAVLGVSGGLRMLPPGTPARRPGWTPRRASCSPRGTPSPAAPPPPSPTPCRTASPTWPDP
ncbi:hypothetical protein [Propioniciclava flava]